MVSRRTLSAAIMTGLVVTLAASSAPAQITNGGTASQNVRGSGARSPGRMVIAGLVRANEAVRDPFAQPQITEVPPLIGGFNTIFFPQVIEVLAQQITDFFEFFANLFLQRAGWPPLPAATDTTTDDTTDTGTGDPRPGRGER